MYRVNIGSDNGLSPIRRQAIICTNAGLWSIGPLGTKFSEIVIKVQDFSFTKMHMKLSSAKWWPFCPGREVNPFHGSLYLLLDCNEKKQNTRQSNSSWGNCSLNTLIMFRNIHIRIILVSYLPTPLWKSNRNVFFQDQCAAIMMCSLSKMQWKMFIQISMGKPCPRPPNTHIWVLKD